MNVVLTVLWWLMAWLFISFIAALIIGPILKKNSESYPEDER